MRKFFKIMTIFLLLNNNNNALAVDTIDKVKKKSKNIFKTLTRKSLTKNEMVSFFLEYVVIIDDKRGDGLVTYYFDDGVYKRYKNLTLISVDNWYFSKLGFLKILDKNIITTWKIQPGNENTINIKKKINSVGKLHKFSYENKTKFYLDLEEFKINSLIK